MNIPLAEMEEDLAATIRDETSCRLISENIRSFIAEEPQDRQHLVVEAYRWESHLAKAVSLRGRIEQAVKDRQ